MILSQFNYHSNKIWQRNLQIEQNFPCSVIITDTILKSQEA